MLSLSEVSHATRGGRRPEMCRTAIDDPLMPRFMSTWPASGGRSASIIPNLMS